MEQQSARRSAPNLSRQPELRRIPLHESLRVRRGELQAEALGDKRGGGEDVRDGRDARDDQAAPARRTFRAFLFSRS